MASRRALVLGATGMVGEPLARALLDDGWHVTGACRFQDPMRRTDLDRLGIETVRFDMLADDAAVLPDVDVLFLEVWDPSTWASGDTTFIWSTNYYGVGQVVERYAGAADIVNGCTINVYGNSPEPASEQTPCRPDSEYGRSRFAQEKLIDYFCQRGGRRGIHVRYAHANRADRGVLRRMAELVAQGESLGADPDRRLQVIALEDFVSVTKRAVNHMACPPAAVNCCHPRVWTQRELAERICEQLGCGQVVFDRAHGGEQESAIADPSRMLQWFGPPSVSTDELISRVVATLV